MSRQRSNARSISDNASFPALPFVETGVLWRWKRKRDMFIELLMIEGQVMFPLPGARLSSPSHRRFSPTL